MTGDNGREDTPGARDATIFVCVACRKESAESATAFEQPGRALVEELSAGVADRGLEGIRVEPVECLAVCKRPCTLALKADGKWTYIIGDLDREAHVDEILAAAESYARSDTGIVPWKERPPTFRKGVIARVPPIGFVQPKPES